MVSKFGKCILVDFKGDDFVCYVGVFVFMFNKLELVCIVGQWKNEEDFIVCVQKLCVEFNLEVLFLICLEEGMSLYCDGEVMYFLIMVCEVFDVFGVGDIVIGMLVVMLGVGVLLVDVVIMVNWVGGIVVGKLGIVIVMCEELLVV